MVYVDATQRDAVQALALDVMDLTTLCAALVTTVKGKMATTIRTQSKMAADTSGANPAIFYVATQGEETIWMGPSIEQHVSDGRYVIIVLCTDGGNSSVRASTGLSVQDFTAARDREMVAALARLGIDESQIMVEHAFDGGLTTPAAERIIGKYVQFFPGASHKTTSWKSNTAQSRNLGIALHNIAQNGPGVMVTNLNNALNTLANSTQGNATAQNLIATIRSGINDLNGDSYMGEITTPTDCRWYLPRPNWGLQANVPSPFYQSGTQKTLDALAEYSMNDPSHGRYAISQRTEPDSYAAAQTDNRVLIHMDTTGSIS